MALGSVEKMVPLENDTTLSMSEPPRALVVDDDGTMLDLVRCMLEMLGLRVDSADGGHAATHCLSLSRYDVVVTDLKMPDMDGYALAEWIKSNSRDTTVIIMTGAHHAEVDDYRNTGIVDRWIFKPFSFGELGGMLGEFVYTEIPQSPGR